MAHGRVTIAEPELPQSLLQGLSWFDYSQCKPTDARKLHIVAKNIRERESKSLIADGRDFMRIKDVLPQGAFIEWLQGEDLIYNPTSIRRAMSVVRLCEGRSKHLETLPVSCLNSLAPKNVPRAVKDAVSAEAYRLGYAPDAQWVWKQIYDARGPYDG